MKKSESSPTTRRRPARRLRAGLLPSLAAAILFLATACDGEQVEGRTSMTTQVDTVNGVVHVLNAGTAPEWNLALVAAIGPSSIHDDTPEAFGAVTNVAFGPSGNVYVSDRINREVRVFEQDGSHVRTFGRQGQGPGEFEDLQSVAWTGSRLLALDFGNARIGEFSGEGRWLGQRTEPRGLSGSGGGSLRLYPVSPDEAYVLTWSPSHGAMMFAGHDDAGPTADTVPALEAPEGIDAFVRCTGGDVIRYYSIPFAPEIVQHPGSDGLLYSAVTNRYRISVMKGADTVRVVDRELAAEPVTDAEWETGNKDYRDFLSEHSSAGCRPRRPQKPEWKPFIRDIFAAPGGRLWVEVLRNAGNRWEVFGPDGALVGSLPATKRRVGPLAFAQDRVATVRRDALDLNHVEIHRILEGR